MAALFCRISKTGRCCSAEMKKGNIAAIMAESGFHNWLDHVQSCLSEPASHVYDFVPVSLEHKIYLMGACCRAIDTNLDNSGL